MLPEQHIGDIPAVPAPTHRTLFARHLQVGDYLPFARRVVVSIELEAGRLLVRTRSLADGAPVRTHRWGPATPVIVAVPRER